MKKHQFKLKYAPHFGMFEASAGEDLVDQLKFAADVGFTAWEDNSISCRDISTQEAVAKEMERLGMEMGVFIATASFSDVTFAGTDAEAREAVLSDMRAAVEVGKRVNARWCTVVAGVYDFKLAWDYQTTNAVDLLKRCCDICEETGLVMVLEPLNRLSNHPRVFLARSPHAFMICKAVNHPCCKILFDIYHQQITEGNLIHNIDQSWSEISYFQVGDNPGRQEPTTGEINYLNIFRHIHRAGYDGLVGLEHWNSKLGAAGVEAVIDAYAASDAF